ncbi:MAG: tetratricopeptide repeat protein [Myxococcota bacterium]
MGINRDKVLSAARKHVRKGKWDKALNEYQKLADDDPSDARSRLKVADLNAKLDRTVEALDAYRAVAEFYARDEMHEKAVAVYKQALRLDKENPELQRKVGDMYHRLGRLKDAVRAFHKAQKIYRERGDATAQREILEDMVRLDPEDVGLRIQLAERYAKDDKSHRAIELFEDAAADLEEEGRLDEWLQVTERLIYLRDDDIALRKEVVELYLDRSDNKHALKHLQVCFKKNPEDLETLRLLAEAFERLERTEKAVMVLTQLATGYSETGREHEARDVWQHVLELAPSHKKAKKALGPHAEQRGEDSEVLTGDNVQNTGMVKSRNETPAGDDDALDGIEFLDEEDGSEVFEVEVEPVREHAPSPETNQPGQKPAVEAGESFEEFGDDLEDLDVANLESNRAPGEASTGPATEESEADRPARTPEQGNRNRHQSQWARQDTRPSVNRSGNDDELVDISESIEVIETVEPTVDHEPAATSREEQLREQLKETDVFLKYGLYDKAEEIIGGIVDENPDSIPAREKMRELYRATDNAAAEVDQLIQIARITRTTPKRARGYLEDALSLARDPARVYEAAKRYGIELPAGELANEETGPVEDLDEIEALSVDDSFVEMHVEDDDGLDEATGDFVHLDAGEVVGLDEPTNGMSGREDSLEQPSESMFDRDSSVVDAAELSMDDAEDIELSSAEFVDMDIDDSSFAELAIEDSAMSDISDDDFVEMDVDDSEAFEELSDNDLIDISDSEQTDEDVNLYVTEDEADAMFDNLFADVTHTGERINLGGDDPLGEMADVDFYLQQGLVTEAEEELEEYREENPEHPGVHQREDQIRSAREGRSPNENPFGARSLSQAFQPSAALEESSYILEEMEISNTNLELGEAYMDMGLYDEAIEEFEHALDDPEAANAARYQIALAHHKLGDVDSALSVLDELLDGSDVSDQIRQVALAARAEFNSNG